MEGSVPVDVKRSIYRNDIDALRPPGVGWI